MTGIGQGALGMRRGYGVYGEVLQKTISGTNLDSIVMNVPLGFIRGGYYYWSYGNLYSRRSSGLYWSSRVASGTNSRYLLFYGSFLGPRNSNYRGYGFAVRCVAR